MRIEEVLSEALNTPTYSNAEILKVQNMIEAELKKQKDRSLYPNNFEEYQEMVEKTRSVPVTQTKQVEYNEYVMEHDTH